jgi:hypothetical protein
MDKNPTFKEALSYYLTNGGGIAFEKYNGKIAVVDLDVDTSDKTLADTDVLLDSNKLPMVDYGFTDMKKLITSIEIKYQKVVPENNVYGATSFCYRTGMTGLDARNNFSLTEGGITKVDCMSMLQSAYDMLGEEKPYTLNADGIRDADTAERLARLIIQLRTRPMAWVKITGPYSILKTGTTPNFKLLEIGDKVDAANVSYLPANIKTYTSNGVAATRLFMIAGINIKPNVGSKANAVLNLCEIGTSNLPASVDWIETGNTGDIKTETGNTGAIAQEV